MKLFSQIESWTLSTKDEVVTNVPAYFLKVANYKK